MIRREDLPADAADWSDIDIRFDRLAVDCALSCPIGESEILEYVQSECAAPAAAHLSRLVFQRTAKVHGCCYWVWQYLELDSEKCFVTVCLRPDGSSTLGLAGPNGLSVEQFLLADYHDEIYWP